MTEETGQDADGDDRAIDVSIIIVNYNSGSYACNLVDGLLEEKVSTADGREGRLEILVVENCSPADQTPWMDTLRERPGVQVLQTPSNLGYGGGCNWGAERARGRNLLFMNPDVFVVPGAVDVMNRYLDQHPEAGQVGPCGWFDCHRFFHLPRIELPSLWLHLLEARRRSSQARAAGFALRRSRHALRIWSARAPQPEPVLAGYAFMMPADFARELGPFDEDYPLYFEDSDLTRRVRNAGRTAMLVPESEMVHLYNKSAGQFEDEARAKSAASQQVYWHKHYGGLGRWFGRRISRWMDSHPVDPGAQEFSRPVDLGTLEEPPVLPVGTTDPYVLELTIDPLYTLAVGRFDSRAELAIPTGVWEHLDPVRFFVRALRLPDLESLGAWTFQKAAALVPVQSQEDFLCRLRFSEPSPGPET